jgi:hypothetical protein
MVTVLQAALSVGKPVLNWSCDELLKRAEVTMCPNLRDGVDFLSHRTPFSLGDKST